MANDMNEFELGVEAPADGNVSPEVARIAKKTPHSVDSLWKDEIAASKRASNSKLSPAGDLEPNLERLEDERPELVNALRELVRQYRQEGQVARRHEIRRIRQARLFWQGLQYAWWNPQDMNWHLPYEQRSKDGRDLEEMPRYQFVTNFYQGFGLRLRFKCPSRI